MGHENIIKYCDRPFADAEAMNKALLHAWRVTVKPEDTIINLGDVSLKENKEYLSKAIRSLPGYKILIMGNHDRKRPVAWWMEAGFNEVCKYPIVYEGKYILSHDVVEAVKHSPFINIHEHFHWHTMDHPRFVNVCVEMTGYKPVPLETIAIVPEQPINN